MRYLQDVSTDELARVLYSLNFPRREFAKLPEHVQASYRRDAERLKEALEKDYAQNDPHSGRGEIGH